jgi:glycosyltransferase involved in cell wall biosynthesis
MKILQVNDHYSERGGVEQYLLAVTRLLAAGGHANAILYRHQTPHTIQGGPWPAYCVDADEEEALASGVRRVIAQEQPDVAYIHHVGSPVMLETLAQMLPTVAYVHGFAAVCPGRAKYFRRGDQVCRRPFGWGCVPMHYLRRCSAARRPATVARLMQATARLRQAYLRVPRLLAATPYMKALLVQNGFSGDRITVLAPHFLLPDEVPPYSPPEQPDTILYMGRLEIEKGFPYLLQALAELPAAVRLVVAGDGTQRSRYEALAQESGVAGRTDFSGWLDEEALRQAIRRCSLVVIPSVCPEPFGKAGIDAFAQGRPVVAFDVGGISDWLQDGLNGFRIKPRDAKGLADKINELVRDERLRARLGQAGRTGAVRQYAAGQHLGVLLDTLESVIGSYPGAPL